MLNDGCLVYEGWDEDNAVRNGDASKMETFR